MDMATLWVRDTGYRLRGITAGIVESSTRLFVTGERRRGARRESIVFSLYPNGETAWSHELRHMREDRLACAFPNVLTLPDGTLCLWYSFGSSDNDNPAPGRARLCNASTGDVIWETTTRSHHAGNGSCLVADVNGDGRDELIWWDSATVFCSRLSDGELLWSYGDRVQICHGRPTLSDVNRDGLQELVFGTEYSNPDGTSSIVALDGEGKVVWRHDGFEDDLGSTPVICADIDGDGTDEFLITGLDLEHRNAREWSSLWCFNGDGTLRYRSDSGCGGFAVGRFGDDDQLFGVGVTNSRDGGSHDRAEIRCLRLADGSTEWRTPIARAYLDCQNPVMADIDGDGRPEVILSTGNPAGYGRRDDLPVFADVYVVDSMGSILWKTTLPDYVHQPFVGDIDADGRNELILPCGDGSLTCLQTDGIGSEPWSVTGGGARRWYSGRDSA